MFASHTTLLRLSLAAVLLTALPTANAQRPSNSPASATAGVAPNPTDLAATQDQLISFLRLSPTLTEAVRIDPTLLADQEYVTRQNPALEQFLQTHPEIARNPDFYLFADLPQSDGRRSREFLRRTRVYDPRDHEPALTAYIREIGPFFVLLLGLAALLWLTRVLLENRRWNRVFRTQTEVHGRLIERFGSNTELLTYMNTEAGRRFLEAAPIPIDFERDQHVPAALSRILLPLQIGVVLSLLGAGLLMLRHNLPQIASPLTLFGIIVLMPGIGFILSAGITWLIAARLGLMQRSEAELRITGDRT